MNWSVTKKKAPRRLALPKRTEATRNLATPPNWTARNCSRYTGVGDTYLDTNTQKEGGNKKKKKLKRTLHWAMTSLPLTSLARRGDGQIAHLASKKRRGKKNLDFKMRLPWFTAAAINRSHATDTPPKYALPSLSMTNECCQTGQRRGTGAEQHTAIDTSLPDSPGIARGISRPYVPLKCIRATG